MFVSFSHTCKIVCYTIDRIWKVRGVIMANVGAIYELQNAVNINLTAELLNTLNKFIHC